MIDPSIVTPASSTAKCAPPVDAVGLAGAEMAACSFDEHEIAASVMSADDGGRGVMEAVQSALREWWLGERGTHPTFNPLKEYVNVGILGMGKEKLLSQDCLMAARDGMDMAGEY